MSKCRASAASDIVMAHAQGSVFLNVAQMAKIMNRGKQTIYNQHSAGTFEVPVVKKGRGLRWHIDDVLDFVTSQRQHFW